MQPGFQEVESLKPGLFDLHFRETQDVRQRIAEIVARLGHPPGKGVTGCGIRSGWRARRIGFSGHGRGSGSGGYRWGEGLGVPRSRSILLISRGNWKGLVS